MMHGRSIVGATIYIPRSLPGTEIIALVRLLLWTLIVPGAACIDDQTSSRTALIVPLLSCFIILQLSLMIWRA